MFFLAYLRNELVRRKGRTILTLLGLAIGVALVIAIAGLSRGLDKAQKRALNPLSSIGTDLTVTLAPQQQNGGGGFGGGFAGGREVVQANQAAVTDLSKLGKPGQHFVHDFFLPGTQLTFKQSQAGQIASLPGVQQVSTGLMLSGVHQAGVVPKIVASIRTGGDVFNIRRRITPPSPAEFSQIQKCFQKAGVNRGGGGFEPGGGGGGGGNLGGQGGGDQGGPGGLFNSAAARKCLPARFRQLRTRFRTPQQTLRQVVAPPQTNIKSSSYTIGGVDPSHPDTGVVTPSLVTSGRFIASAGADETVLAGSYAKRAGLKIGSKLDLNGTTFKVVGLVRPPLGGQTADVYISLSQLQSLAGQKGLVNVVLVRAKNGASVGAVQKEITQKFPNAQVASAKQVADSIGGSLVDASNLSHRLGVALAALAAAAAFLLAALLTLSSVGKRVRELGTLKALGWSQRLVVRQVVGESLAQGLLGGLLGVGLGLALAAAIGALGPTLTASSHVGGGGGFFGLGQVGARTLHDSVALTAPVAIGTIALGFLLAVAGGLIAGAAGALRAARLRPADALRQVE